jgi:hypothetical protein
VKYVLLILVLFGAYSGYRFMPVMMAKGSVAHAVKNELVDITDSMTDDQIRKRIMRRASAHSLSLEEDKIWISRERRNDLRFYQIDVEVPITISYLGSERTIRTAVHVDESVPVDTFAEARQQAAKKRYDDQIEQIGAARDQLREAREDCERATGGPCRFEGVNGPLGYAPRGDVEIIKKY